MRDYFIKQEKFLRLPYILTFIVLTQAFLIEESKPKQPKVLEPFINNPLFRFSIIVLCAFTASEDIEISIMATIVYLIIMQLLRTKEERKQVPYWV